MLIDWSPANVAAYPEEAAATMTRLCEERDAARVKAKRRMDCTDGRGDLAGLAMLTFRSGFIFGLAVLAVACVVGALIAGH